MVMRALFAKQAADGHSVVARARHWHRPAATTVTRFRYPELDPPCAPPEPAAPPLVFNEDELARALEAARRQAYGEAEAMLRAEMAASLEHRRAEALGAIAAQLAAAAPALERTLAARAGASRDLALAIARALVTRALALQPLADVEAMLRRLVLRLEGEPWLEVALPPELIAAGETTLARVAAQAGYRGELRVMAAPGLGPGDARVTWQEGAAERDLARIEAEAVALVDAWLPIDDNQAPAAPAQREVARTEEAEQ